ncbi:MAG: hypothetical protein R3A48_02530 [Polyangiales bacterium]
MKTLRWMLRTEGRGAIVLLVWLMESALAWALAAALGSAVAAPLLRHPSGVFALYGEDGRLLMDFLRVNAGALTTAGAALGVAVALWAGVGVPLGGVVPLVGASRMSIPTAPAAFGESLRRAPTLLALALLSAVGYGLVGLLGWFAWRYIDRSSLHVANARMIDLRHAAVIAAVLLLAALVSLWHALARFQAMGRRYRALSAAASSLGRLGREPLQTLGRALGWALMAGLGTLVAFAVGAALDRHRALWAVALLTAAQQLSLLWRVHCRMRWYGGLPVRDEA